MGKVLFNTSVSLDGFVAGPNDEVDQLFKWYSSGDTEFPFPGPDLIFRISAASAALLEEASRTVGAMVTGRRNFDNAHGWSGSPPLGVHHFVVTHHIPQEWVYDGSPFTFVTEGVERAVELAKKAAGEKDVAVSSATVMRQCLQAGLLDEIGLDLVPVLLGEGIPLWGKPGIEPVELEPISVVEGTGVTHLRYRVVK